MISADEVKRYGTKVELDIIRITSTESFPAYVRNARAHLLINHKV